MAYVNAVGDLQPEAGDVLPAKVAYRDDDPQHIREYIDMVNPTIKNAQDLVVAIEAVDALRREFAEQQGKDPNPALQSEESVEEK